MNLTCPICGTICTTIVFDPNSGLREWECNPSNYSAFVKRVPHYSFMTKADTVVLHRILEIDSYRVVIQEHPIPQTTVMKHSRENSRSYYQTIYEVSGAMDLSNFDKEKFLKKLKTYTVFA